MNFSGIFIWDDFLQGRLVFYFFMRRFIRLLCLSLLLLLSVSVFGQSFRKEVAHLRERMEEHGKCKNVVITKNHGVIALFGVNGFAHIGCQDVLEEALVGLNMEYEHINDIQLTEKGRWLVQFGVNGIRWNDIPQKMEDKLWEYNENEKDITCATFAENEDWIVVTPDEFAASDSFIFNWLEKGSKKYVTLLTAHLTDDAMVAVYSDGCQFSGKVPKDLKKAIEETDLKVYRVKITGSYWFFADEEGNFRCNY